MMLIRLSAAVVGIVSLLSVVSSLCMHKVYSHKLPFTRVERFLFYPHPHPHSPHRYTIQHLASSELLPGDSIARAPFNSIIPFLSEHVQPSDQILFVGTKTDLCLQLASAGYGTKKTGFMLVVDDNKERIRECESIAASDKQLAALMSNGQLRFVCADLTNMPEVCKQSHFDAVVDYYGLDSLLLNPSVGMDGMLRCIDHLQNAVRLGNILVCLSALDKQTFCTAFDKRFGWVQELDGDPGEASSWYRGKTNIAATESDFQSLGLKMYVYTNTDNC